MITYSDNAGATHCVQHRFAEARARDNFDGLQYVAGYNDLVGLYGINETLAAQRYLQFGGGGGRRIRSMGCST